MSSFLDAVIVSGPNEGKTIGECLAAGVAAQSDAPRECDMAKKPKGGKGGKGGKRC